MSLILSSKKLLHSSLTSTTQIAVYLPKGFTMLLMFICAKGTLNKITEFTVNVLTEFIVRDNIMQMSHIGQKTKKNFNSH